LENIWRSLSKSNELLQRLNAEKRAWSWVTTCPIGEIEEVLVVGACVRQVGVQMNVFEKDLVLRVDGWHEVGLFEIV